MTHAPETLLSVTGLRKAFGGLIAVRDISFEIKRGSIAGLIGPNGSGKTTVLNLITAELSADAGSIQFRGHELVGHRAFEICRARIARTFQLVRVLPGMTALENVMLGRMFGAEPARPAQAAHEAERLIAHLGDRFRVVDIDAGRGESVDEREHRVLNPRRGPERPAGAAGELDDGAGGVGRGGDALAGAADLRQRRLELLV